MEMGEWCARPSIEEQKLFNLDNKLLYDKTTIREYERNDRQILNSHAVLQAEFDTLSDNDLIATIERLRNLEQRGQIIGCVIVSRIEPNYFYNKQAKAT